MPDGLAGPPDATRRGGTLLLLRHGQSQANADDVFAGWLDVPLTARGEYEAARAAQLLSEHSLMPDVVHTSLLTRSIRTAEIALATLNRPWLPTHRTWRLNERHYGALQGRAKTAVRASTTDVIFHQWRRAYRYPLPPANDLSGLLDDRRYALLPPDALPRGEALCDVQARLLPYWCDTIAANLYGGLTTLVIAHGSPLRALIMHLDRLDEDAIASLNVPTGIPLRYDLDADLCPVTPGGVYLDPHAAAAGAAEVAAQGGGPLRPPHRR
ncbi:MAG: 2,3-bisphosphoglycerate-dependent phosphoglycerate mutase [Nakamurella sp.]